MSMTRYLKILSIFFYYLILIATQMRVTVEKFMKDCF